MNTKVKALKMNQRKLFWLLVLMIVIPAFVYLFSLNMAVFNTAKRVQIERELDFLRNKIGELEFAIVSEKSNINLDFAHSFGFEEAEDVKFISRKSVATIINSNNI